MPAPADWSSETLLAKAKLYVEEMELHDATDWRYALWSSFALELLARAALAHTSPVLLAKTDHVKHIYFALGIEAGAAGTAKSIEFSEVASRLNELHREFTPELRDFAVLHLGYRNAELHSGAAAFPNAARWVGRYYSTCKILLKILGLGLGDFVGDAGAAEALIREAADDAAKSVKQDITSHNKVWLNLDQVLRDQREQEALAWAGRERGHRVACPACRSVALVEGRPLGPPRAQVNEAEQEVVVRQAMLPTGLRCVACNLRIAGEARLRFAERGDAFTHNRTESLPAYFGLYTEDEVHEAVEAETRRFMDDDNNE